MWLKSMALALALALRSKSLALVLALKVVLGLDLGLDCVGQMPSCYTPVSIRYILGVYCLAFFFVNH